MEKPILFNTEMVQAILSGRKTQTRRIIKQKYENADIEWFTNKYGTRLVYAQNDVAEPVYDPETGTTKHKMRAIEEIKKPCNLGDILWVRETWKKYYKRVGEGENCYLKAFYGYKADENINVPSEFYDAQWKPSIHMPRAAARLFFKVTNVRVERLQDITEADALAEGIKICPSGGYVMPGNNYDKIGLCHSSAEMAFRVGFEEIYPDTNDNTWVWVIEFERIEK